MIILEDRRKPTVFPFRKPVIERKPRARWKSLTFSISQFLNRPFEFLCFWYGRHEHFSQKIFDLLNWENEANESWKSFREKIFWVKNRVNIRLLCFKTLVHSSGIIFSSLEKLLLFNLTQVPRRTVEEGLISEGIRKTCSKTRLELS